MNDLIYRDQVIEVISKLPVKVDNLGYTWMIAGDVLKQIDDIPSAELKERTAKVETVEKPNVYRCSECGQYFHSTAWGSPVLYCSRCGAKLDWSGNE